MSKNRSNKHVAMLPRERVSRLTDLVCQIRGGAREKCPHAAQKVDFPSMMPEADGASRLLSPVVSEVTRGSVVPGTRVTTTNAFSEVDIRIDQGCSILLLHLLFSLFLSSFPPSPGSHRLSRVELDE